MVDPCDPSSYISQYNTNTGNMFKSVECVSLEADTITTTDLVLGGVSVDSEITIETQKTQNQSTSLSQPNITYFAGTIQTPSYNSPGGIVNASSSVETDQISGNTTISGTLSSTNQLLSENNISATNTTNTTGANVFNFFQPNLNANTTNAAELIIGAKNENFKCGSLSFDYISSGNSLNGCTMKVKGGTVNMGTYNQFSKVNNGDIRVGPSNTLVNPRITSSLYTFANNRISSEISWDATKNIQRITVNIADLIINANTGSVSLQFGSNPGLLYVNNPSSYQGLTYTQIEGQADESIAWPGDGIRLFTNSAPLTETGGSSAGTITLTKMGNVGNFERWTIFGTLNSPFSSGFGDYVTNYTGWFQAINGFNPIDRIRILCNSTTGTIISGFLSITTQ